MRRGIVLTLALVACLLSACALNPPRIVSISPSRDVTDVATNQAISISFDRPMNRDSVEKRFAISKDLKVLDESEAFQLVLTKKTLVMILNNLNFSLSIGYPVTTHTLFPYGIGQKMIPI